MTARPSPMAVTGFSLRTPLGDDVESIASRMLAGDRMATPNARFDARTYPCRLASTISIEPKPAKHRKFVKRMGLFGIEVGTEAFAQSSTPVRGPRLGLFCGYGGLRAHWDDLMPVLERQDGSSRANGAWSKGFSALHPFWMLFHLSNNAHALLSINIGATGDGTTTAGSNAGAQALRAAIAALEVGSVDAAIVFAYDSLVEPETILSLGSSGAATTEEMASAVGAPYGEAAAGFVPGEAAAAVVLERPADAAGRAAGVVVAAMTADGSEGFADPSTLAQALSMVAHRDSIVDGAGLAHRERDDAERAAIAEILGRDTTLVSTAAGLGQMGAATPLVQTILLTYFLSKKILPPIAGLKKPSAGPVRPLLQAESTQARSAVALSCGMPGLVGAVRVELP
jgi:3-oxoacyl-[acyl-carrier-protein] synthase II